MTDIKREIIAANRLREHLIESFGEDDELLRDMIEGETDLSRAMPILAREIEEVERVQLIGITSRISQLKARHDRLENRANKLRDLMRQALEASGNKSLALATGTYTRKRVPPKLQIIDESLIPAEFWREPPVPDPKPDKLAIARALKDGASVDGCTMDNGGESLQIKWS